MYVRICPKCHSYAVHRSRRRGFVERFLLPLVLKRPYRCDGCNSRYYGYAYAQPLPAAVPEAGAEAEAAKQNAADAQR